MQEPPPKFGHAMRKLWSFDPGYVNLNNGSFGTTPRAVLATCRAITARIEANPDLFHRIEYMPLLRSVRERLARFIGANTDECVLVMNASHGVNTVLRNFDWAEGDVLIANNTTYMSVSRTVRYLADIPPNPTLAEFNLTFPTSHAAILDQFREHLRSSRQRGNPFNSNRKMVAVVDSIVSAPGVYMPWREMVQICREEGVWSVVDGAHSIGQEVGIDLKKADPDFWVSNCHKWLYAKRPCAVLYVPKRNQHIIKSTIPTSYAYVSPSSGQPQTFIQQFEWNGTIDYAPVLSVGAALDFREYLGGEEKINAYCRNLAREGGRRLAEIMGTEVMASMSKITGENELMLNMVNVRIPLPSHITPTPKLDVLLTTKILVERKISALHYYHAEKWWIRASAQVWNEMSDFEKLGQALLEVCAEIGAMYRTAKL